MTVLFNPNRRYAIFVLQDDISAYQFIIGPDNIRWGAHSVCLKSFFG